MKREKLIKLVRPFEVTGGGKFRLKDYDPADKGHFKGTNEECGEEAKKLLHSGIKKMSDLQSLLYAQDRWSLLLIFQAMDAAGKDGTIKHVMSGINPQGCSVHSFKSPSAVELDHDFLWRSNLALQSGGGSGFSTGAITRRCWWCACTRRC